MRRSRVESWLGGALLALLVLTALFLTVGPRPGSELVGSIGSTEARGRRALALLLGRTGLAAEGWRQVPAALPRGPHAVWLAAPPVEGIFAGPDDEDAEDAAGVRVGMHALEHYAAFVRRGGTLIVEGPEGLAFLRDDLGLEAADELELRDLDRGPRRVRLSSGEEVDVEVAAAFEPLDPGALVREVAVLPLQADLEQDLPLAVAIPAGEGRALLLADGTFLDNGHIGARDHALLGVRLSEEAVHGGRLLLDEYALGVWEPESAIGVAGRGAFALVSLHALLLLLLWTWMRAAPRAFPRDPEPLESFSPVLRAKAHARLHERAGRVGLLAGPLRRATCQRLCAHLRIPWRPGRAAAGESVPPNVLERLAVELGPDHGRRAFELLGPEVLSTRADLERLARDLEELERAARG